MPRRLIMLLVGTLAVIPAVRATAAKKKAVAIPAELTGVVAPPTAEDVDPLSPGVGDLVSVKLLDAARTLAGRKVVVWEERRTWRLKDDDGRKYNADTTFVGIADVEQRTVYFLERVASTWDQKSPEGGPSKGKFTYTYAWQDLNGDGEDELVLTRTAGDDVAEKIFQARHGGFRQVARDAVACPRDNKPLDGMDVEPDLAPIAAQAVSDLTKALDASDATATRCALATVAFASPSGDLAGPRSGSPLFFRPVPTPKNAKQAKKPPKKSVDSTNAVLYLDAAGYLYAARVVGGKLDVSIQELGLRPSLEGLDGEDPDNSLDTGASPAPHWAEAVELDGVIYVVSDVTNKAPGEEYGEKVYQRRDVFITDAISGEHVAIEPLVVTKKKQKVNVNRVATWKDVDGDGVPELTVAPKKGKQGMVTWRYDKAAKKWSK